MVPNIKEFLSRVLPWPGDDQKGYINTHVMGKFADGKSFWSGVPTTNVDKFLQAVYDHLSWRSPPDVYMCMSRQLDTKEPKNGKIHSAKSQKSAAAIKSVYLDVDVGKPKKNGKDISYATILDALDAVKDLCVKVGIPGPTAIVASGGGLHVYWISDRDLTIEEWRSFAEGLKQAALMHGLLCDAGITGDCARVLRVPGTFNYKQDPPRPVKLVHLRSDDYDFKTSLSALPALAPLSSLPKGNTYFDPAVFPYGGPTYGPFMGMPVESLSMGLEREDHIPVDLISLIPHCGFFREAFATGGSNFSQGLWNLTTLASTFAENGHEIAHKLARGHPEYTFGETEALWARKEDERRDRGLGWPSCVAIQSEGCSHCAACPHLAKGKSPLHLSSINKPASPARVPQPVANFTPATSAILSAPVALTDQDMPDGYTIVDGVIHVITEVAVRGQPPEQVPVKIFHNEWYDPWTQSEPNILHATVSVDKGHYKTVSLKQEDMGSALFDEMFKQGVKPVPSKRLHCQEFLVSWLDKLHRAAEAVKAQSFGWVRGEAGEVLGFSYGGVVYNADGSQHSSGSLDPGMKAQYAPRGAIKPWIDLCNMITDMKRPGLEAILAVGLGSPLMIAAGQYNGMLAVWGDSGSGKTTALIGALAVWQNPKLTREGPTSTLRSVLNKMGRTKNLPLGWDEIKNEPEQAKAYDALFVATGGAEGSRLNSNIEVQSKGDWQQLSVICSNPSFGDYVIKRNPDTKAGLMRLLEYHQEVILKGTTGHIPEVDATAMRELLDFNYGRVGEQYAKALATNYPAIQAAVRQTVIEFDNILNLQGDERFWGSTCAAILSGAALGNHLFGLRFDLPAMKEFLVATVEANRARTREENVQGGTADHALDYLSGFLNSMQRQALRTDRNPNMGIIDIKSYPQAGFATEVHWLLDQRKVRFSRRLFRAWLMDPKQNASPRTVMEGIKSHYGATVVSKPLCLGSGTQYVSGQQHVIELPVPAGSPLELPMLAYSPDAGASPPNIADTTSPVAASSDVSGVQ